jgi:hypothetical protein
MRTSSPYSPRWRKCSWRPLGRRNIELILTQLRNRQIAEEQVETYGRQEKAAVKERELKEAESRAEQQRILTESEVSITIQSNEGKAQYQRALQQAAQIRALAEAEAEKAARIGIGQAIAIEEQVRAYGGPQYRVTQEVMNRFSEAVQQSGVDVVPRVVITGSGARTASQHRQHHRGPRCSLSGWAAWFRRR